MDVNNFGPFAADVWGTFSDWVMISATAVTAFYLIRTFANQELLKKIELIRYVESIKPSFTCEIIHIAAVVNKDSITLDILFTFKNVNGTAKDVTLDVLFASTAWSFFTRLEGSYCFPIKADHLPVQLVESLYTSTGSGAACSFQVAYSDIIGNKYIQNYAFTYLNGNSRIESTLPMMQGEPVLKI